jgi:hypothetical protein
MTDVEKFNAGLNLKGYSGWLVPMPSLEVMQRRVFANLRPVGSEPDDGKQKSGDVAFDLMMSKIITGTSIK